MVEALVLCHIQPGDKSQYPEISSTCPWGYLVTDELIANCRREVERAIADGNAVAICTIGYFGVNDESFGPTDPRLMELLAGYDKARDVLCAAQFDGAHNVVRMIEGKPSGCWWPTVTTPEPDTYRVIGVRTNGCVLALVSGLRRERPEAKIVVVKDCCNDDADKVDWTAFEQIENVELV